MFSCLCSCLSAVCLFSKAHVYFGRHGTFFLAWQVGRRGTYISLLYFSYLLGSNNDINVLDRSPLLRSIHTERDFMQAQFALGARGAEGLLYILPHRFISSQQFFCYAHTALGALVMPLRLT